MNLKHFLIFIGLSLLLHIVLLLLAFAPFFAPGLYFDSPVFPDDQEMTLTVKQAPKRAGVSQFIDTSQSVPADRPPENTPFEGAQNTAAASPTNDRGDPNRPTVSGRDIPSADLNDQRYSPSASQPSPPPAPPPAAEAQPKPPAPKADSRGSASLRPEVPPAPPRRRSPSANPASPSASNVSRVAGRHLGGIAFQGAASVAAKETELGRYMDKLYKFIGSRWYQYVAMDSGLLEIGTVRVKFYVQASGNITDIRVTRGDQHTALKAVSLHAITDVNMPQIYQPEPFSPGLKEQLGGGFEDEVGFTIY